MKSPAAERVPDHLLELHAEPAHAGHAPSCAMLQLGFGRDGVTTRLIERAHFGPLRVQKPLYPEGPQTCHAVIVHPPGGVVGGDRMTIDAAVRQRARALLTTPGAAKWYRANGRTSHQTVTLSLAPGGVLEWLPQETIVFDGASVVLRHDVAMASDATYIGSEILCFGRTAAGEFFNQGNIAQRTSIRYGGKLIWYEQGAIVAGSAAMRGTLGLRSHTVCATLIAAGTGLNVALADAIRSDASDRLAAADAGAGTFGVSVLKNLLVARYLGDSSAMARLLTWAVWNHVRPVVTGRVAVAPRVWNT